MKIKGELISGVVAVIWYQHIESKFAPLYLL